MITDSGLDTQKSLHEAVSSWGYCTLKTNMNWSSMQSEKQETRKTGIAVISLHPKLILTAGDNRLGNTSWIQLHNCFINSSNILVEHNPTNRVRPNLVKRRKIISNIFHQTTTSVRMRRIKTLIVQHHTTGVINLGEWNVM